MIEKYSLPVAISSKFKLSKILKLLNPKYNQDYLIFIT